jgi:hypothetical protein
MIHQLEGGRKIAQLPKIKIVFSPGLPELDPFDLEQARDRMKF